jgi:hypothetical protein
VDPIAFFSPIGRRPRTAGKFFAEYQYRILLRLTQPRMAISFRGKSSTTNCTKTIFAFCKPEAEYFDCAPATTPSLGRWRMYGMGLPETILKKVYYENSARILRI